MSLHRRDLLKLAGAGCLGIPVSAGDASLRQPPIGVHGPMTGAAGELDTIPVA